MVKQRSGFSLLELIISIVIVAITSISVPMIISVTAKQNEKSVAQEALLSARTFLKVITSSAYTCDYIIDNPYSLLPRFTEYGSGANENANRFEEVNYHSGDNSTPSYNFYTKYGLDETGRRVFYDINKLRYEKKLDGNTLRTGSTDGERRCIQDFINAYKATGLTMNADGGASRDFIGSYRFTGLEAASEYKPYRATVNNEITIKSDPTYDIKHVRVEVEDTNSKIKLRLIAFVANIGDAPIIQTRAWQ